MNIDFNKDTLAIVVSDIHIGNEFSRIEEFTSFLIEILKNKTSNNLPNLRVLIILGDFFDLNATSCEDLCSNNQYSRVFRILEEIKVNKVEIVLTLGNHEISTVGFYNLFFSERKKKFVKLFKESNFSYNFLALDNICQYLILSNYDKKIILGLFDSAYDEAFKWIFLGEKSILNDSCYLMSHGYQYEDKDLHHSIAGWWDIGRNLSQKWKRVFTSQWAKLKNILGQRNHSRFYNNITVSQEDNMNPFSHVIFGHTHKCEIKDARKINTGCWLNDYNPSFLEIYINGNCELFELSFD